MRENGEAPAEGEVEVGNVEERKEMREGIKEVRRRKIRGGREK